MAVGGGSNGGGVDKIPGNPVGGNDTVTTGSSDWAGDEVAVEGIPEQAVKNKATKSKKKQFFMGFLHRVLLALFIPDIIQKLCITHFTKPSLNWASERKEKWL
jgi:hypothetical protein